MGRALLIMDSDDNRRKAVDWIGKAPDGTRIEFKASKRTLPQNDLLWALLTEIAQQVEHNGRKYEPSQWKAIFLHAFGREVTFLPSLDGKTFLPIELSSSDLSKDEMTDFIEFIMKEAAERGVVFKNTNPADDAAPSSSAATADDAPTSAEDGEASPSASSSSTLSEADWLIVAARMLWAATPMNPSEESIFVLNNQRKAVGALMPPSASQETRDKAGSIYIRCKGCIQGDHSRGDTLRYIANMAGCDVSELEGA